jgi:hypothetical protein
VPLQLRIVLQGVNNARKPWRGGGLRNGRKTWRS